VSNAEHIVKFAFKPRTGLFVEMCALPRSRGRAARSSAVIGCVVAVLGLLLFVAPVWAASPVTLAGEGSGAGQVNRPDSVAIDQSTGTVYVADSENQRVDEFDSSGHFLLAFGVGVLNGADELQTCTTVCEEGRTGVFGSEKLEPNAVIVDDDPASLSYHDIYVSAANNGRRVLKFSPNGQFILMLGKGVDKTTGGDLCTAASGDTCGEGEAGTGPGEFDNNSGDGLPTAVDASSGDVWVGDVNRLEEFSPAGAFLSEVKLPGFGEIHSLALDPSGDFYTTSFNMPGAHKLTHSGEPIYTVDETGHVEALGLDGAGHLFIGEEVIGGEGLTGPYRFLEFDAITGAQTELFGAGETVGRPSGNALAFNDSAGTLYVASSEFGDAVQIFSLPAPGPIVQHGATNAGEIRKTSATLRASVNPEGRATTYHYQYVDQHDFETEGGFASPHTESTVEAPSIGEDFEDHVASLAIPEGQLTSETSYRFRVVASSECEPVEHPGRMCVTSGETASFQTLPPLRIDSTSVSSVTATSATLQAQIDPLGDVTSYHFEYLTEAEFQADGESFSGPDQPIVAPQPDAVAGSGEGDQSVPAQHLQGLSPDTVYRYRVVATNAISPTGIAGPDHIFITQGAGGSLTLPDGRDWELVSPPDKHGAGIQPNFALTPTIQASSAGGAMAYLTVAPTEDEPAGNSNFSQVLSIRGPDGWASRDIALPHNQGTGLSSSAGLEEYRVLSSDLSLALIQPFGAFNPSLSEEASEQTEYLRTDYLPSDPSDFCTTSCYRPLVTAAPGFADVPPGTEFGVKRGHMCPPEPLCGPEPLAATQDLSHVVLSSSVGLTATPGDHGGLYEWSDGQLQLVSGNGDGPGQGTNSGTGFVLPKVIRHSISSDGSRIYFTDHEGNLNVRENIGSAQARTLPVPGGAFQTASADGSRAFVLGQGELSEFNLETAVSTPLAAGVQGVIGASEDGASVYFVSIDALTGEEQNGEGEQAQAGQPNLYLYQAGNATFIASLSQEDLPDWYSTEESGKGTVHLTARVSPDGHWLAFMSQRSVTGYDNHDAVSGAPDEEVFLYHAPDVGAGGTLVCASCDPTGARPRGVEYSHLEFGHSAGLVGGGTGVWNGSQWLAANVPAWNSPYYQSRYLSDGGRLFFNSSDALLAQDTNGTEDVYEYEPPGSGDCTKESPTFDLASSGCVGLISSGASAEESGFLDASEDGSDVFFVTKARLAVQDVDSSLDVYDAHACTASVPCLPAPPLPQPACEGDACQQPVSPPNDLTPASLTFSGSGNLTPTTAVVAPKVKRLTRAQRLAGALKACKHKSKRKRSVCEKQARRAYGSAGRTHKSRKRGK
jgi:DNA-binding beta-propeller fold protein YncE